MPCTPQDVVPGQPLDPQLFQTLPHCKRTPYKTHQTNVLPSTPQDVVPGQPLDPQLARRANSYDKAFDLMKGREYVVEVKFDGERVLVGGMRGAVGYGGPCCGPGYPAAREGGGLWRAGQGARDGVKVDSGHAWADACSETTRCKRGCAQISYGMQLGGPP